MSVMDSQKPAWQLPEELRDLAESGDADLVNEVLSVFQSDTATRIQQLRDAYVAGDIPQVQRQAHTIKGSAGQIGAEMLAAACLALELSAKSGDMPAAGTCLAEVEVAFAEACRALQDRPQ